MSIHKSLVQADALRRSRNVLTRAERIKILEEEGRHVEGDSPFGLPKVRTIVKAKGKKKKKKKEEEKEDE